MFLLEVTELINNRSKGRNHPNNLNVLPPLVGIFKLDAGG